MLATGRVLSNLELEPVSRGASRRCVRSPVVLSGDGHTRRRRQHYLLLVPANIWRIWTTFAKRKQSTRWIGYCVLSFTRSNKETAAQEILDRSRSCGPIAYFEVRGFVVLPRNKWNPYMFQSRFVNIFVVRTRRKSTVNRNAAAR